MSKNDDTEEKQLPPSQIKLNRLKREGQVAHSKDVPAAASLIAISGFLILGNVWIYQSVSGFFDVPLTILPEHTVIVPRERLAATLYAASDQLMNLLMAPLMIGLAVALVSAIIDGQGLFMSMKNMAFDLSKLNPAEGLKKIFSLSSLSEFLKSIIKCAVMMIAGAATLLYFLNALFWAHCAEPLNVRWGCRQHYQYADGYCCHHPCCHRQLRYSHFPRALPARTSNDKNRSETRAKGMYGSPEVRSARSRVGAELRSGPPNKVAPKSD